MIRLVRGRAIARFIEAAACCPSRYRRIVLCSPFLDSEALPMVKRLAIAAAAAQCGLILITTRLGRRAFDADSEPYCRTVVVPELHAKVYFGQGREPRATCVILGSANLTMPGLTTNVEACVVAKPTSTQGHRLVADCATFLDRLIDRRQRMQPGYRTGRAA
jgi:hypothetical protein